MATYNLGEIIKKRREELGMSQDELAKKLGYKSRSSIYKIEIGENDIPHSKLESFAAALKVGHGYLLGWEDENGVPIEREITVSVPNRIKNYFHFRAETNDMIRAFIPEGAYVQCCRQRTAEDGQIVCCLLNEKHVLRRYKVNDGFICLSTENDINETKIFTEDAIENGTLVILGVVKSVTIEFFSDNVDKE